MEQTLKVLEIFLSLTRPGIINQEQFEIIKQAVKDTMVENERLIKERDKYKRALGKMVAFNGELEAELEERDRATQKDVEEEER